MADSGRARERWEKAHAAMQRAESARLDAIAKHERRCGELRQNERIAYKALYESVPCVYCGADAGKPCIGPTWPEMHRTCTCKRPVPAVSS